MRSPAQYQTFPSTPDDPPPDFVVTLVHGTFAPGAPWTADGSALRAGLGALAGGRLRFHQFHWPGGIVGRYNNTFGDRRSAANRLRAELNELLQTYPDARHIVIGHSHGGNVALRAVGDPVLAGRLAGVACLATPFLSPTPRDVSGFGESLGFALRLIAGWIALCGLPSFLTSFTAALSFSSSLPLARATALLAVLAWIGTVTVAFGISRGRLEKAVGVRLAWRQDRLYTADALEVPPGLPVFVGQVRGDEAWGLLASHERSENAVAALCRAVLWVLLVAALSTAVAVGGAQFAATRDLLLAIFMGLVVGMLILTPVGLIALLVPFVLGIVFAPLRSLLLGPRHVLDAWLVRTVVVPRPGQFPASTERRYDLGPGSWRHSRVCDAPTVIADLAAWITALPRKHMPT